jgi:hypothetical protein
MVCSQYRRCQIPFSRFATLLFERVLPAGKPRENKDFEKVPTQGVIGAVWQLPEGVQMVWKDADRQRFERKTFLHCFVGAAQTIDFTDQKIAGAVRECDSEEK